MRGTAPRTRVEPREDRTSRPAWMRGFLILGGRTHGRRQAGRRRRRSTRRSRTSSRPSGDLPRNSSTRRLASRSTRCATRRPTSWPRRSSISSPARSSASGRPSRTASTTTSSSSGRSSPTTSRRSRHGWRRASPPTTRSSAASCHPTRAGPSSPSSTSRSRSRSSTTWRRGPRPKGRRCRRCRSTSTARSSTCARDPHVESTGKLGPFKLLAVAGAYWRGDEKRPMLQRIYGTVWPTQEELDQYLWRRAEAKKRDHRRLGVQLDLYSFHDVSPGSAFWHPKGQMIWRTLEGAMRELQAPTRLPGGQHPDPGRQEALAAVGPLGPLRREHVQARRRRTTTSPSSR